MRGSRKRDYKVYQPNSLTGSSPMVMVLHGCEQTHETRRQLIGAGLVAAGAILVGLSR
jgi:poly(3-hydroxybutyrate) depolymerase